jgi:hypothetical protein
MERCHSKACREPIYWKYGEHASSKSDYVTIMYILGMQILECNHTWNADFGM